MAYFCFIEWYKHQDNIIEEHVRNILAASVKYLIVLLHKETKMVEPSTDMDKILLGNTRELKEIRVSWVLIEIVFLELEDSVLYTDLLGPIS